MDNYFDPVWDQEHQYLAGLWKKLLVAPGNRLLAQAGDDLFLLLQKGGASADRLVLSWGPEKNQLNDFLLSTTPFVAADDLSSLFLKAQVEGLPFSIDEYSVPLDLWKPEVC